MQFALTTDSAEATISIGEALGHALQVGDLLRLDGELGSGKTTLCSGIGRGLGSEQAFSSPSYLLCKEYVTNKGEVLHMDAYFQHRLESLLGEGMVERLDGDHIVLIEWANRIENWLPAEGIRIQFQTLETDVRRLHFLAIGTAAEECLQRFCRSLGDISISIEPEVA
ncbi:MAG: tRNA (adenosine(37)-N6)-threonylcarbamoyltransferase complex ATPase subunit type 1 TsaE [Planctomycetes bacterium]|nr:tRNA (adenosine(37)-N6)-threonylcarbamoyltransferase complex ATPase subunit type 1 TsaE [Planctomycetota bacterium]